MGNGEAEMAEAVLEQTAQRLAAVGSSGAPKAAGSMSTGGPQKFQLPDKSLPAVCARGAHLAGVGPEVVESLSEGVALSRWIDGEAVKDEEMHDFHTLEAVVKSLREFHGEAELPRGNSAELHSPMLRVQYHLNAFPALLPQDLIADMQNVLPVANRSNGMLTTIAPAVALHGSPRAAVFMRSDRHQVGTAGELQMIGFEHCHLGAALWDLAYLAVSADLSDKELLFAVERYGTQRLAQVDLPPLSAFSSRHAKRRLSKKDILRIINLMQAIHLIDLGILALVNSVLPKTSTDPAGDLAAKHKELGKDFLKKAKQALESEPIQQTQAWLTEELKLKQASEVAAPNQDEEL